MSKKTISKKLFFVLASVSLLVTACKKNTESGGNPITQNKKLIKIEESATNYSSFEYNTDATLKKLTTTDDTGGTPDETVVTYTYDGQKKISEAVINSSVILKYLYANNRLEKVEFYANNIKAMYNVFEYNNNRIAKITRYFSKGGANPNDFEITAKNEYSYYDNGNVKEKKEYFLTTSGTLSLAYTQQFDQYDAKVNPLQPLSEANLGFMVNFSAANNALHERMLDDAGETEEETVNTYTYDAAGYPLTAIIRTTSAGGAVETKNLKYIYQ
jgi:predicted small secreted protein